MKLLRQQAERPVPQGVYASLITPRREGEVEVDLGAMLDILDFVAARGVSGVVLFGATGEFLHFTPEERGRFVGLAAKRSRVPVLVNVSHSTLDGAVALAEESAGSGAAGVLAMPPYFYRYDDDAIRTFFLELAARVGKWTPIYLDNVPSFTNPISSSLAEELLRTGAFAGIKDSSGDWEMMERLIGTGTRVLCAHEPLLARARQAGAAGAISGLATAVPELMVALDRAASSGDPGAVQTLEVSLAALLAWVNQFPAPVLVRQVCGLRGIKAGGPAVPLSATGQHHLEQFRAWFRDWLKTIEPLRPAR